MNEFFLLGLILLYLFFLFWGIFMLFLTRGKQACLPTNIAVLVIARNEENNVGLLLEDLLQQTVKIARVYVYDDHSEDKTVEKARSFLEKWHGQLIIRQDLPVKGKSDVWRLATKEIEEDLIVIVDADCRVQPGWLESIIASFGEDTVLVSAPVLMNHSAGWWERWVYIEHAIVMVAGFTFAGLRLPLYLSGANMLFRKNDMLKYFTERSHTVPYGDDVFFMQYVIKKYGKKALRFSFSPESVALTNPPHGLTAWADQRVRWLSKAPQYQQVYPFVVGVIIFFFELVPWVNMFFNPAHSFFMLVIKSFLQAMLLSWVLFRWKQPRYFLLAWGTFFLYVWLLLLYAAMMFGFDVKEWKGREVKKN